jgi:C_GCAxxG_C_C family probable redox protein
MSKHEETAIALFLEGYSCAQAIAAAFSDETELDASTLMRLSSPFGGGIGGMKDTCGAFGGICIIAGLLYGYDQPGSELKKALFARIQDLAARFQAETGAIACRDIVPKRREVSDERQPRLCAPVVGAAARVLDRYIEEQRRAADPISQEI